MAWYITYMSDAGKKFSPPGNTLTFQFDSQEAAEHFKAWLCEQGEQDYWTWMEYREQEEDGDITALKFNYHTGDDTIPTECGRLER